MDGKWLMVVVLVVRGWSRFPKIAGWWTLLGGGSSSHMVLFPICFVPKYDNFSTHVHNFEADLLCFGWTSILLTWYTYIYIYTWYMAVSEKGGITKSSHFRLGCSMITHPATGVPPWLWKPHSCRTVNMALAPGQREKNNATGIIKRQCISDGRWELSVNGCKPSGNQTR